MASAFRTTALQSLSERRGKHELQYLHSRSSSRPSTSSRSVNPQPSISSFSSSNRSYPTTSNNSDVMSIPATPTEHQWYANMGSLAETCEFCGPQECTALGLGINELTRRTEAMELSEGLHITSGYDSIPNRAQERAVQDHEGNEYHYVMPPTPPSHDPLSDGRIYFQTSRARYDQQELADYEIDADAFGSLNEDLSKPATALAQPAARGRRMTLLEKMLPQKFREGIRRRMSGQSTSTSTVKKSTATSIPPVETPPLTPPTDDMDIFWPLNTTTSTKSTPPNRDFEFELPLERPPRTRQAVYSPLQSPRSKPTFIGTDVFPELAKQSLQNEIVHSPLHPPSVSHFVSYPTLSASQTSLSIQSSARPDLYTVPSIDPTSPKPCRKLSDPIDLMSPDTITQLIMGMEKDEEAYTWMIERMKSHGWSSPEEIRNLECQREESKQKWQLKINGAKRVLAGLNKRGYPAFQFPDRSTKSMDSVRSDFSAFMGPCIAAGPGAQHHRTYSQ